MTGATTTISSDTADNQHSISAVAAPVHPAHRPRKLRPLVITMGSSRQRYMTELFSHPTMAEHFDKPTFIAGVPSRSLRSRCEFFRLAHQAGLLPDDEWEAIQAGQQNEFYKEHPERFFDCLKDVPVAPGRRGSEHDVKLHYSVELWQKAKGINRGRAVLACTFAHLLAMKRCVAEGYDLILEDNVRAPPEECAKWIWETLSASQQWEYQQNNGDRCHLRYYGWLGSIPNVRWVLNTHSERNRFTKTDGETNAPPVTVFPFPLTHDIGASSIDEEEDTDKDEQSEREAKTDGVAQKPGGTPIWGAYTYWISPQGLDCLLKALRTDVGAVLWKGKRQRHYMVKPIDKVMPRQVMRTFGRQCVHVTTNPSFFRAPMLTSKIHSKWDAEFCKSTAVQMRHIGLTWSDLWLSDTENRIVRHFEKTGVWLAVSQLREKQDEET